MNIDQSELKKFAEMAHYWWDKSGSCKPLHDINPLRLKFITDQVSLKGKKVLDVGCGGGILSEALARAGANVTAIDMSPELIQVAKLHLHESKLSIDYQQSNIETFAEHNHTSYDVVTCMELLEHVPNPESIIAEVSNLLNPNGFSFFSTINRNPKAYLFAIIGAEYLMNMLPKGTHEYEKFIRPSELDNWARRNHLTIKQITGMSYDPISKQYSLGKDVNVNYLVSYQKT